MCKRPLCLLLLAVLVGSLLAGCGTSEGTVAETTLPDPDPTEAPAQYGALQELVDSYGFPFELRHTEGMGITWFKIYEDHAEREWHHSLDGSAEHGYLTWRIDGELLEISGAWQEAFSLDMENGTATSTTDGTEYRLVVYENDGDISHGYVE